MPFQTGKPDFSARENAVSFLDAAFRAAELTPPTGLSPVYRDTVDSEAVGVEIGAIGMFHAEALARALFELAARRGNVSAMAREMPELGLSKLTGQRLEALGVIPAVAELPKGASE